MVSVTNDKCGESHLKSDLFVRLVEIGRLREGDEQDSNNHDEHSDGGLA